MNRYRKAVAAVVAAAALAGMAGVAHADVVTNDVALVDSSRVVTVVKGGAAQTVNWTIAPSNTDPSGDATGCNATGSDEAYLAPAVAGTPAGVVLSAPNVEVVGCGNPYGLSFSATSAATAADYVVTVSLTGGKTNSKWNTTAAGFTLRVVEPSVSAVAPTVSYTLSPSSPNGDNDWYKTGPVTLSWTVTGTPAPSTVGCEDQVISLDQVKTPYECSATNSAGNDHESVEVGLDSTAPTVSLVGGPVDGVEYYFGSVPAEPTCSASDATSGLAGTCSRSGYSSAVGTHTVTASATDNAGNNNSASASYTVKAWTLSGFYAPVDMGGVYNTVKGGSTVPLKFEVFAGDELTNTSAISSFVPTKINCTSSIVEDTIELTSTGGTALRYDSTAGQFIQNWQTPKTAGPCYKVTMTTQDGSTLTALFKLK